MKGKKKTNEEFLKELREVHGDDLVAAEDYINIDTKIKFRCNIDGYEWMTSPYLMLKGCGCPCCSGRICIEEINSLYKLRPDLIKYFKNKNNSKTHTVKSGEYADCICPDCGFEKRVKICNLSNYGFKCDYCSDKISLPNRFVATLLKHINISFKLEETFSWAQKKRYDVYIPNYKGETIIIENQGIQHNIGGFENLGGRNLQEEQENDKLKEILALEHKISKYVKVYFYNQYNTFENCKDSILNSSLNTIFNLKDVKWSLIWEECQRSLIIQVWETWNTMDKNIRSTVSVGKLYGIDRTTVARYLKLGVEIKRLEYNPLDEQKTGTGKFGSKHPCSKKVICLNTLEMFESITLATKKYKVDIYRCCSGKTRWSGKSDEGVKLIWKFYEEYKKMSLKEVEIFMKLTQEEILNEKIRKQSERFVNMERVVCLTTKEVFANSNEASLKYNIVKYRNIDYCCDKNNKLLSSGTLKDKTKLVWRYYNDYIIMTDREIEEKISEANNCNKGKNNYKSKKIICINTKQAFDSQREAGEYYGIKFINNIGACCRGERKVCGKLENGEYLKWEYLDAV